jgi:hypothetical protein
MPPAVGLAIGGIAGAIGTGVAAKTASNATKRASTTQQKANDDALQMERERDAEARRQWDADQAFKKAQWEAQEEERLYSRRRLDERDARAQPYRDASVAALGRLPDLLGGGQGVWRSPSQAGRTSLADLARRS